MNFRSLLDFDDAEDNRKVTHFLKQLTFFSGGNSLAQLIMMVYAILVARALGNVGLGVYSGIYAFLGVTITLVNFGMDTWMLKVSDVEKPTSILTGKVVFSKLIVGLFWVLICNLLLPILKSKEFLPVYVLLASLDVLADVNINTLLGHLNITKEIHHHNILLLASRLGKLVVLFILMVTHEASILHILLSRLFFSLLILGISFHSAKPKFPNVSVNNNLKILRDFRKASSAYGFSEILAMVYANADVAILSLFSTSQAGLYSPASGIIHALFILPNSFHNYLLPIMSKRERLTDSSTKRKDSLRILVLFGLLGALLTIFVVLLSTFALVPLLGKNFYLSMPLLLILSPIMFFKCISFGFATLIVARSQQSKRLVPQLIVAVFDVLLVLFLIPRFGATGVAWAYLFAEIILSVGYWIILMQPESKVKYGEV